MKKLWIILLTAAITMTSGVYAQAGIFNRQDDYKPFLGLESIREEIEELWNQIQDVTAGFLDHGSNNGTEDPRETEEGNPDGTNRKESEELGPDHTEPKILTFGDYDYWINEDKETATIFKYNGDEEEIEIPAELNGHPVSDIGIQAFTYLEMKSLVFPDSIRNIGPRSFEYCVISDSIGLPENVTIENDAFSYAELPSVLVIPAGVKTEECAFSYCDTIEQVFVGPEAVIEGRTFGYCPKLNRVVCANGSSLKEDAFEYCDILGDVVLCGEVEIEKDAFSYCGNIFMKEEEESSFDVLKENPEYHDDASKSSAGSSGSGADDKEISLEILNSPASGDGVTVTLDTASAKRSENGGFQYSFSGTIENNSDEGIMQVVYTFTLIDENGEEFRTFSEIYDGEDTAIPPYTTIDFSHDDIRWGPQSVPVGVVFGIGTVKTETELPPAHIPETGDFLYQTLDDENLENIKEEPPTELSFHVDQGGYGRTAVFEKGEELDKAVELLCNIKIAGEADEWVTDNYNWIGLNWEDGTSTCISLNLYNLEYFIHSAPHTYLLENLDEFWTYASGYLEEDGSGEEGAYLVEDGYSEAGG